MIQPVFEKINYYRNAGKLNEQVKVEIKTEIPSNDVAGVLSLSSWVGTSESVLGKGQANFAGRAVFYLSFVHADGEVKKFECATEFSGAIKDQAITDACKCQTSAVVERAEADTAGAFLTLTAFVLVSLDLTACENVNALVGGQNVIANQGEINVVKKCGAKKSVYPLEEEFDLNYTIKEVLYHRADAIVTSAQSGVGCIIVDGQVLFSLVLLQNNDKNDIIREDRVFPFRMEIECEEAMPNMQAVAFVKERSHKTDVSVDNDSAKSLVSLSVSLAFEGEAFMLESMPVAIDAFSEKNNVKLDNASIPMVIPCDVRAHNRVVKGESMVTELPVGATVLAVSGERATVAGSECNDGQIKVVGLVTATVLLKEQQKVFARKVEIPFEQSFDGGYDCDMSHTVKVKATMARARILSLTQMEMESELFFTVYPLKKSAESIITGITALEEKEATDSAITVYIPAQGEQLWSLAKRLNVSPTKLIETNKDLQFPLTGEERIVVYRGGAKQEL